MLTAPRLEASLSAERDLSAREAQRLVDIVLGRAPHGVEECHYLIVLRSPLGIITEQREIEQFRDIERLVASAADFETGDRHGKWLGAFTAVYRDGNLASLAVIEDMPTRIAAHKANPSGLRVLPVARNLLADADREIERADRP